MSDELTKAYNHRADVHEKIADTLPSGDKKDGHLLAALKDRKAAREIVNRESASLLVRQLRAYGHSEKEIQQLTERDPSMTADKYWRD
jgi:hypothetical protein